MNRSRVVQCIAALAFIAVAAPVSSATAAGTAAGARDTAVQGYCVACW